MKHRQPHPRFLARPSYMQETVEGLALDRVIDLTDQEYAVPTSVAGLRIDDRLATVALTAVEQGWRPEPAPDGKGLVLYSPDPAVAPVRVGTARVTPKHVSNFKSELRRGGVNFDGPPPGSPLEPGAIVAGMTARDDDEPAGKGQPLAQLLADTEGADRAEIVGNIVDDLGHALGMPKQLATLATILFLTVNRWHERGSLQEIMGDLAAADLEVTQLCETLMTERDAARAERDALQHAADRADEKARTAAHECGEALERARAAEARAASAENDLATIRRLLGKTA